MARPFLMETHPEPAGQPPRFPPGYFAQAERLWADLVARVRRQESELNLEPLERAYRFAFERHINQVRDDGTPYIVHPLEVAEILAGMGVDLVMLQTALLHDVLEDTSATAAEIRAQFGPEVELCVNGVTKLTKLQIPSPEKRQAESFRKMVLAMAEDPRVMVVKLADRLHNMRTLGPLDPERQRKIAEETLEVYAPIAHRLGMGKIRGELEDLAFAVLEPEQYLRMKQLIQERQIANQASLERLKATVMATLNEQGVPARVEGRVKRPYSVYQKLRRQRVEIHEIYDLLGLRIITETLVQCYHIVGLIHAQWTPVPGRFKDFIALPRQNGYQSLHTSVIGPGGQTFEVQIRTEYMHKAAELGVAAHWLYKDTQGGKLRWDERKRWMEQLRELQKEVSDPQEFVTTLKRDLYADEVYAFTPKGKVIILPRGATPIDFAYAIHSDIGHTCVGARVNGRIVSLRYHIKTGDIVEILTQPGHMPSRDWLAQVKTIRARNKIRQVVTAQERAQALELGARLLEREARRAGVALNKVARAEIEKFSKDYGYGRADDLYTAIGMGRLTARTVIDRFRPAPPPEAPKPVAAPAGQSEGPAIRVRGGIKDLLYYLAKCCNPIRGEAIVGYVTRGKGIAIHSVECPETDTFEPDRRIEVEWERSPGETYVARLMIFTDDRVGMLNQFTSVLNNEGVNIRRLEAQPRKKGTGDEAVVDCEVDVRDKKQLERICAAVRRIPGVRDVERIRHTRNPPGVDKHPPRGGPHRNL